MRNLLVPLVALLIMACSGGLEAQARQSVPADAPLDTATFAGGCFWCVEEAFDQVEGVVSTTSGYTGGHTRNPTYQQVITGRTGHAEVVRVVYDPARVSYPQLLNVF
jgi:peptide methionine sulfoxide reductase MsrA